MWSRQLSKVTSVELLNSSTCNAEEEILNAAGHVSTQAKRFQGGSLGPYNLNSAEVLQTEVVVLLQGLRERLPD